MADIGSILREARMRAHIDITEVEARTKIRAKYLRAMENEEWDLLPGPVYVKSFLRTYGDYLGVDSRLLIDEFRRRYERPSDHDLSAMSGVPRDRDRERRRTRPRGPLVPSWAIVAVVLVAVVVVLYVIGSHSGNSGKPASAARSNPGLRHQTPPPKTHRHHRKPRLKPAMVALQIVPTAQVYVCVTSATGHVLIPGSTYDPGQTVPTETARELLVTLGNNAVEMKVNGKPYTPAPSAAAINLKVTSTGVRNAPPGQDATCS